MILICVAVRDLYKFDVKQWLMWYQTDVIPALSLCLEKPESGLLERPPRNVKTERLADWKLLLHAYGFLGVVESLCAMSMYAMLPRIETDILTAPTLM